MFEIHKAGDLKDKPVEKSDRIYWPWKDMGVGDMVKIADAELAQKAQIRCHTHGRQSGKKFATQTIGGVLHVWRTA